MVLPGPRQTKYMLTIHNLADRKFTVRKEFIGALGFFFLGFVFFVA